jgi:hypothetical protein
MRKNKIIAIRVTELEKKIWIENKLVKKIRKWILKHS